MSFDLLLGRTINISSSQDEKPDDYTKEEQDSLEGAPFEEMARAGRTKDIQEIRLRQLEVDIKKQELKQKKQEHKLRKKFSSRLYWLICIWLFILGVIVFASATNCLKIWPTHACIAFELPEKVMITILTSTTVTVLGLFVTVLRYMFGGKGNNSAKSKED